MHLSTYQKMRKFIRQSARAIITSLNHYHRQGDKRDILILASPRSGSSWLMELFYAQRGMKYLNIPLERLYLDFLHILPQSKSIYVSLNREEEHKIKEYFSKDRPIRHCGPLNIFEEGFNFFTNRRVLKIHKALPLIQWIADEFAFDIIHLIRHPIPQSISAKRHGSSHKIDAFLSDITFAEKHLNLEQRNFLKRISEGGTDLEKYVTTWCLENLVPLKVPVDQRSWITISYEELVTKPLVFFNYIKEQLHLEDIESIMNRIKMPSRGSFTSPKEKHRRIKNGDIEYLISGWIKEVDEAEADQAMKALEIFDINAYRHGRFIPDEDFLLFK